MRYGGITRVKRSLLGNTVLKLEHLCPHCYAVAESGQAECDTCMGTFKSPRKAGLLSLLFPGIGNFYMGHRKLAALEFVVVAFFWVALFLPEPEYPMTVLGAVLVAAIIVVFLHVPDAVGTWFLARRGVVSGEGESPGRRGQSTRGRSATRQHSG